LKLYEMIFFHGSIEIYQVLSDVDHPDRTPGTFHGEQIVRLAILLYQRRWSEYDEVEIQLLNFLSKRHGKQFVPKVMPVVEALAENVKYTKDQFPEVSN